MIELPRGLLNDIESGDVCLFLGAGASMGCVLPGGERPPSGQALADIIASKFLSADYHGYALDQVAELAISQTNLYRVQDFIAEFFIRFNPTESHNTLASFRWHGIATTNYDLVLERAYQKADRAAQDLKPIYRNGDQIETKLKGKNAVAYMKLHGCVTIPNDDKLPLILTSDQYESFREGRERLFSRLKEWGSEFPIVFVGYSLQDKNLRKIINELDAELRKGRPRYYLVGPGFRPEEISMWESRRISALGMTLDDFVNALDSSIGSTFRGLVSKHTASAKGYLQSRIPAGEQLSERARLFIEADVDVVNDLRSVAPVSPDMFYQASDSGWGAIESNLDVRRRVTDTILERHIVDESDTKTTMSFVLLKGHAGSGKSITMKRLAWDIAHEFKIPCLYLKELGELTPSAVVEIARLLKERVAIFVDDIIRVHRELASLIEFASDAGIQLLVVGSVRQNEFNSRSLEIEEFVTQDYELSYLSENEIRSLIALLDKHKCLGELESKTPEERFQAFRDHSGRQLLVALHEATHALPFREIISDEFRSIHPEEAKQIYRTICVLYRFKTPVRAGLISRIHGVGFREFSEKFLGPLERIVRVIGGNSGRDYCYVARHPQIADMVYHDAIERAEDRLESILKCLLFLDLDYSVDREAFYQLTNHRTVLELSKNRSDAKLIYDLAVEKSPRDAVVLHQWSLYEMKHPSPHLHEAESMLVEAKDIEPNNPTILHSFSELAFNRAKNERVLLRKQRYLDDADEACRSLISRAGYSSHSRHTLIKIKMEKLKLAIDDGSTSDEGLSEQLKDLEAELSKHKKATPNDHFLLSAEADLAKFLSQTERLLITLEKAFKANPKNLYSAISFARAKMGAGDRDGSESVVRKALEYNEHEPKLHFLLSRILIEKTDSTENELLYHLRRSFTPGDRNYDAQLMHARQLYVMKGPKEADKYFAELANARVTIAEKREHHFPLTKVFHGRIGRMLATACFIKCDENHDQLFAHESDFAGNTWKDVVYETRVKFRIAFNFRGPLAFDVSLNE